MVKGIFVKQTSFTQISSYCDNKVDTVFCLLGLFASLYVTEYTSGGEGEVCFVILNRKTTELKKRQLHAIGKDKHLKGGHCPEQSNNTNLVIEK